MQSVLDEASKIEVSNTSIQATSDELLEAARQESEEARFKQAQDYLFRVFPLQLLPTSYVYISQHLRNQWGSLTANNKVLSSTTKLYGMRCTHRHINCCIGWSACYPTMTFVVHQDLNGY